ncbi:hypothetical protein HK098_003464 [Nowakowskiella sp. JEL0407]|nr:hypothetical protein HK098_003464 [Nowakowskiella sp. JEL0407]
MTLGSNFLQQLATRCPDIIYPANYNPDADTLSQLPALPTPSRPFQIAKKNKSAEATFTLTFKVLKSSSGGNITFNNLTKWDRIETIKARLAPLVNIPPSAQRLVISGKALAIDSKTLMDYDVKNGAIVHVLRKQGAEASEISTYASVSSKESPSAINSAAKSSANAKPENDFSVEYNKIKTNAKFWEGLEDYLISNFESKENAQKVYGVFKTAYNQMN